MARKGPYQRIQQLKDENVDLRGQVDCLEHALEWTVEEYLAETELTEALADGLIDLGAYAEEGDLIIAVLAVAGAAINRELQEVLSKQQRVVDLAESEAKARQQAHTANWAKAELITLKADGTRVAIRPNGDWATSVITSADRPLPVATTTSTGTVTVELPLLGAQTFSATIESTEASHNRHGSANISNKVQISGPVGVGVVQMTVKAFGNIQIWPDISLAMGNPIAAWATGGDDSDNRVLTPTFKLMELTVS